LISIQFHEIECFIFRFPKDPELCKQWVLATKRRGFIPSERSCLCSKHFEENAFEVGGLRKKLKKDAVPTLFDFPTQSQKIRTRKKLIVSDCNCICKKHNFHIYAIFLL
jgi:hypothetical protein